MENTWRDELIWCAGFYDGEGHTRANWTHKAFWQVRVDVTQSDRRVLDRFHRAVLRLGKVYGPYKSRSPQHRDRYTYAAIGTQAQAVIAMIWPWLDVMKREQARDALLKVKTTAAHIRVGLRTTCEKGHALDEKNTHYYTQTQSGKPYRSRACRKCAAQRMRDHRAKRLAHALLVAV